MICRDPRKQQQQQQQQQQKKTLFISIPSIKSMKIHQCLQTPGLFPTKKTLLMYKSSSYRKLWNVNGATNWWDPGYASSPCPPVQEDLGRNGGGELDIPIVMTHRVSPPRKPNMTGWKITISHIEDTSSNGCVSTFDVCFLEEFPFTFQRRITTYTSFFQLRRLFVEGWWIPIIGFFSWKRQKNGCNLKLVHFGKPLDKKCASTKLP